MSDRYTRLMDDSYPLSTLPTPMVEAQVTRNLLNQDTAYGDGLSQPEPAGVARSKPYVSKMDFAAIAVSLVCFGLGLASFVPQSTAVWLGQTDQLIVLGFLLSIMAFCTQRQVQIFGLLWEVSGKSTLQNFDALLRNTAFTPDRISVSPRALLLFLFALPLALSVSYKKFSGGSSVVGISSTSGYFGTIGPPGYQRIGNGLSLLTNVYLPFWTDPGYPRTYGFNLFVADKTTTAILDAPFPEFIESLQVGLGLGDSLLITTDVNATVAENIDLSTRDQSNLTLWNKTFEAYPLGKYPDNPTSCGDSQDCTDLFYVAYTGSGNIFTAMLAGTGSGAPNNSEIYLSVWNSTAHETFQSTAERFILSRRICSGTWNITAANVSLIGAKILQSNDEAMAHLNQDLIQGNQLWLFNYFRDFLGEYNWRFRQGYPYPNNNDTLSFRTSTALAAAMVWARIVSLDGAERSMDQYQSPSHQDVDYVGKNGSGLQYWVDSSQITTVKETLTLKRDWGLYFIIAVNPMLAILAVLGKVLLYPTPIDEKFGLISMLAGVRSGGIEVLRGASLSGKLKRQVKVGFAIVKDYEDEHGDHVEVHFDAARANDKVASGRIYR
ncbi:MAG: hypothetical protein M1827_000494 [Pycnora praestabilis]|nr:MAG: hypothetical protein M1827_000494 [Pycnora praestabilis]